MPSPFVLEDPFEVDYERAADKRYPSAYREMMSPTDDVILMDRSNGKARFHAGALPRSGWSPGKKAAAGAAGALLAGALTVGLMKLLSKNKTDNGGESRKESRKEIRRTTRLGPGGLAYKKGGVAKKRKGKQMKKKMARKAIRKVARKN